MFALLLQQPFSIQQHNRGFSFLSLFCIFFEPQICFSDVIVSSLFSSMMMQGCVEFWVKRIDSVSIKDERILEMRI